MSGEKCYHQGFGNLFLFMTEFLYFKQGGILVPRARRFLITWSSGSGDENGKEGE